MNTNEDQTKCLDCGEGIFSALSHVGSCSKEKRQLKEIEELRNEMADYGYCIEERDKEIKRLRECLKVAKEALKSGIREGSRCNCSGYDVNKHQGYGHAENITRPLEIAFERIAEIEDKK